MINENEDLTTRQSPAEAAKVEESELMLDQAATIPIVAEQLRVAMRTVETGKVKVHKNIVENQHLVDIPLIQEAVEVERVPFNLPVETAPPPIRYEGETMIISVLREEVVVTKRLVLIEELRLKKQKIEMHNPQQVTLKKEQVEIERIEVKE